MVKTRPTGPMDVVVIGAGPAGVLAALRAAELGARTTLVTRDDFGGMAAGDGPVPVRTLAYAARLFRGVKDLARYGITVSAPELDYGRLLARTKDVVEDVRAHSAFREHIDRLGVTLHERTGNARFADPHTIETESGLSLPADRVILCAGGKSRRLSVPGAEFTHYPQRCVEPETSSRFHDRRRRRNDRRAGRFDLSDLRLTRESLSDRAAHSPE